MINPTTRPFDSTLREIKDWQFTPTHNVIENSPIIEKNAFDLYAFIRNNKIILVCAGAILILGTTVAYRHYRSREKAKGASTNL